MFLDSQFQFELKQTLYIKCDLIIILDIQINFKTIEMFQKLVPHVHIFSFTSRDSYMMVRPLWSYHDIIETPDKCSTFGYSLPKNFGFPTRLSRSLNIIFYFSHTITQ